MYWSRTSKTEHAPEGAGHKPKQKRPRETGLGMLVFLSVTFTVISSLFPSLLQCVIAKIWPIVNTDVKVICSYATPAFGHPLENFRTYECYDLLPDSTII